MFLVAFHISINLFVIGKSLEIIEHPLSLRTSNKKERTNHKHAAFVCGRRQKDKKEEKGYLHRKNVFYEVCFQEVEKRQRKKWNIRERKRKEKEKWKRKRKGKENEKATENRRAEVKTIFWWWRIFFWHQEESTKHLFIEFYIGNWSS